MPNVIGPANRIISLIYRYGRRYLSRELKGVNVDVGQYPFLIAILRNPGITQEQLCERLGMDRGTTARSVAALEEQGFIIRETDRRDRRINHISATDRAEKLRDELFAVSDKLHSAYLTGFTDDEKQQLAYLLLKMRDNIKSEFEKE